MKPVVRFIFDIPRTALFNMTADRYLMERCNHGRTVFLRFYHWTPPAISLGCGEKAETCLNIEKLASSGIDWIKRPTGGRTVLHYNDITYSCIFPASMTQMGATISETYHLIAKALLRGLQRCGIQGDTHDKPLDTVRMKREKKLPCFLAPNRDEIMVDGKKLAGSAQKRTRDAVLQHGSIPVTDDFRKLPFFLTIDSDQRERQLELLSATCTCINECGAMRPVGELMKQCASGFEEVLPFEKEIKYWTPEEENDILSRQRFYNSISDEKAV